MQQHESTHSCQCDVCKVKHFERNNYFHGKMLSARDLRAEQEYFNEKRWLINRTIAGWGIVCGLEVKVDYGCFVVEPGLALDCCGHELLVCEPQRLHPNKIAEQLEIDPYQSSDPIHWVLCLEYQECKTEPVKPRTGCHESEQGEYNHIRDHYKLRFRAWDPNQPKDPNRDQPCPKDHNDFCCPYEGLGKTVSVHKALVDASLECSTCEDCDCVVLAIGTLEPGQGQNAEIQIDEDSWKFRRIVYTNPALANLIRCFHGGLAHISHINWKWQRPDNHYDVDQFLYLLTQTRLQVTFDHAMNQDTVEDPRSLRLSVYMPVTDGSCPVPYLVPVDHVEYAGNVATYYFDHRCIEHNLRAVCKKLPKPAEVEIVLHGSMVLDVHNRALDAELIRAFPTGNGVQGGEFITYFTVGQRDRTY